MREWQSHSHVNWYCKYHIVFVPKYRKKVIFGRVRQGVGKMLRELCEQQKVELVEGHAMADHVHLCLSIPPNVQRSEHCGNAEREVGDTDSPRAPWEETQFHRIPFLGTGY
jgi:putative transposase